MCLFLIREKEGNVYLYLLIMISTQEYAHNPVFSTYLRSTQIINESENIAT